MKYIIGVFCSFVFLAFFSCGKATVSSEQISNRIEKVMLGNGLEIYSNQFSYGLNGQHGVLILSDRKLSVEDMTTSEYPVFHNGSSIFLLDTLPTAILYYSEEPKNKGQLDKLWLDRLKTQKVTGSHRYQLSQNKSKNIIELSF